MIGFAGAVGFNATPTQLAELARRARGRLLPDSAPAARHNAEHCAVSLWDEDASGGVATEAGVTVLAVGDVYDPAAGPPGKAAQILRRYRAGADPVGCSGFDGSYAYLILDPAQRRAILGTDENSFIPVYYTAANGILTVGWDVGGVLDALERPPEVDEECLFAWLLVGGRGFEDRTRFRDVRRVEPGAAVIFESGVVETRRPRPFGFEADGATEAQLLEAAADTLRTGVERRIRERRRLAIGLSGGLDSRMVLAAAVPRFRGTWYSYTYGRRGFAEHDIARSVADFYRLPHATIVFPDNLYRPHATDGVAYSGGASLFKHGVQPHLFAAIRARTSADGVLLGSALDLVLGSTFSPGEVYDLPHRQDLGDYYRRRLFNLPPDRFRRLIRDRATADRLLDGTDALLSSALASMPGEHPADVNDALAFHIRIRRWYNHNLVYPLCHLRLLTPTYDHAFLKVVGRVPWTMRRESVFRIKLLSAIDAGVADIAYDETMQPAWLLPPHTKRFEALTRQVDDARLQVWFDSGRTVYVPSNRYDANFLEWLRVYPAYRDFARELLTGPRAVLTDRYFDPAAVLELIDRHVAGDEANHKILTMLMSAELAMRLYVSGDRTDLHEAPVDFSRFLDS